jgi:hypothetical protein
MSDQAKDISCYLKWIGQALILYALVRFAPARITAANGNWCNS